MLAGLLLVALTAAEPARSGVLCLDSEACRPYECGQPVAPSESQRFFTFTAGATTRVGTISACETVIPCSRAEAATLSGKVLTRAREPFVGAMVASDSGDSVMTDAFGRFAIEAEGDRWPKVLTVSAPGFTEAVLAVPPAHASKVFEDVLLGRGATIAVELEHDPSIAVEVSLKKYERESMAAGRTVRTLAGGAFEDVPPGEYVVLAKGEGPLEQYGQRVTVTEGERKTIAIRIAPFRLRLRATMKSEPLGNALVRLRNVAARWEGDVTTDSSGEVDAAMWQGGKASATLRVEGMMTAPYLESRELTAGDACDWWIDVPAREITGSVIDSGTGKPIADARVVLKVRDAKGTGLASSTRTNTEGSFRFAPAGHGAHEMTVAARGYLPSTLRYSFEEPAAQRSFVLRLDASASMRVTVLDTRGTPVTNARMIAFRGETLLVHGITDATGSGEMPAPAESAYDLFVIPRDGSFGFAQVQAGVEHATIRIPDGVSRIVVQAESRSREPIANVALALRYNGRMMPAEVLRAVATMQGIRPWTAANGRFVLERMPVGMYELSPAGERDATARMAAEPGENVAVLTFEKR